MQQSVRITFCACCLSLAALTVQAAEPSVAAPAAPAAVQAAQPSVLKPPPGLSLLPAAKAATPPVITARIGVVDINRVSSESAMGKAAQAQIKAQQLKLQKQVEAKKKQIEKFKADTERQMPTLTPPQREAKSKEFQKKVEAFQRFGMHAEKELMASQEKLTKGLFEAISKAADELGKGKGLTAVVVNHELLYLGAGVEPVDMTADLVKSLDEKGTKK